MEVTAEQKKDVIPFVNLKYLMCLIMNEDIHIQSPALRLAGNIASGDAEDTQLLLNAGLLKVLAYVLQNATDIQKREILWILSNITAGNIQQISMVINTGFVKHCITVANNESFILQSESLWVLCNAINGGTVEQVGVEINEDIGERGERMVLKREIRE